MGEFGSFRRENAQISKSCRLIGNIEFMAKKLPILGVLALLAVVPVSASTFVMFMQNSGTPTPLTITDVTDRYAYDQGHLGSTTISLINAPILWNIPNTLGTGYRTGLLTFNASTSGYAAGVMPANTLDETGFSGSVSIFDVLTQTVMLSWRFGPTGTLTVDNNGHTGSFVDSTPLRSEGLQASASLSLPALTTETFHFSLFAPIPWKSNGVPIIYNQTISPGICTSCRIKSNDAVWALDDTGAPEPATMAMLGSALVGLGLLGRKRFVR